MFEDFILNYKKYKFDLVIRENGIDGDHPHLNIIWDMDLKKRTNNFTALIKGHMTKAELPEVESPVLVRTQNITDVDALIGGYLQKEDNFQVLFNSGKYDLEALARTSKRTSTRVGKTKWKGIMTYGNAALDIIDYCEANQIDYLQRCRIHRTPDGVQKISIIESNTVVKLLFEISKINRVQVIHLFRRVVDIHMQVLALLANIDDIYFLE